MFALLCSLDASVTQIGGEGDSGKRPQFSLTRLASGTRVCETYTIFVLKQKPNVDATVTQSEKRCEPLLHVLLSFCL